MLALKVLHQYTELHVLIVRTSVSKYAQPGRHHPKVGQRRHMHTPAPGTLSVRSSDTTYPGGAEHVQRVRADLRALLAECLMADEVILCASELAANAAIHSRSRLPGGTFIVRVVINSAEHVRIEVQDDGGPWTPSDGGSAGHHGLDIVRTLATDWGID